MVSLIRDGYCELRGKTGHLLECKVFAPPKKVKLLKRDLWKCLIFQKWIGEFAILGCHTRAG